MFSQFVNWTVLPADPESISLAVQDPVQEIIRIGKKKKKIQFKSDLSKTNMVLVLDGISEIGAHEARNLC